MIPNLLNFFQNPISYDDPKISAVNKKPYFNLTLILTAF